MDTGPDPCPEAHQPLSASSTTGLPARPLEATLGTICSSQSPIRLLAYRASGSSRPSWSSWPDGSPCWKPSSGQVMAGRAGRGKPSQEGPGAGLGMMPPSAWSGPEDIAPSFHQGKRTWHSEPAFVFWQPPIGTGSNITKRCSPVLAQLRVGVGAGTSSKSQEE